MSEHGNIIRVKWFLAKTLFAGISLYAQSGGGLWFDKATDFSHYKTLNISFNINSNVAPIVEKNRLGTKIKTDLTEFPKILADGIGMSFSDRGLLVVKEPGDLKLEFEIGMYETFGRLAMVGGSATGTFPFPRLVMRMRDSKTGKLVWSVIAEDGFNNWPSGDKWVGLANNYIKKYPPKNNQTNRMGAR